MAAAGRGWGRPLRYGPRPPGARRRGSAGGPCLSSWAVSAPALHFYLDCEWACLLSPSFTPSSLRLRSAAAVAWHGLADPDCHIPIRQPRLRDSSSSLGLSSCEDDISVMRLARRQGLARAPPRRSARAGGRWRHSLWAFSGLWRAALHLAPAARELAGRAPSSVPSAPAAQGAQSALGLCCATPAPPASPPRGACTRSARIVFALEACCAAGGQERGRGPAPRGHRRCAAAPGRCVSIPRVSSTRAAPFVSADEPELRSAAVSLTPTSPFRAPSAAGTACLRPRSG